MRVLSQLVEATLNVANSHVLSGFDLFHGLGCAESIVLVSPFLLRDDFAGLGEATQPHRVVNSN